MEVLNNFSQIVFDTPVDQIIKQIRDLISSGQLKPGDRLPSERQLSERLNVGRTHLRDAIRKLEFYGILKTVPQSGTYVAGLGIPALQGLITDMLALQGNDFKSLVETRVILEMNTARLAAEHRTAKDLKEMEQALHQHRLKVQKNQDAVDEDFLFHLKIADSSKNSVLKSLMLIIAPDIMQYFKKHDVCGAGRSDVAVDQHEQLLQHIVEKNPDKAVASLLAHLDGISEYVKHLKEDVYLSDRGFLSNRP
ncbi:MAG: FadR/GntR family transcriptional regulator [Salibacteraceae bacterium]